MEVLDSAVELAPLLSNLPQRPMYTKPIDIPLDRERARRHPLSSERASHFRITSAHPRVKLELREFLDVFNECWSFVVHCEVTCK